MGVPKFVQEFVRNLPVFGRLPKTVSSLSIDFNSLIHEAAQYTYAYGKYVDRASLIRRMTDEELQEKFFSKITELVEDLIASVHPQDTLVLSIDGVVPLAKQWQQRQRRYRPKDEGKSKGEEEKVRFDSNLITPGTPLMKRIDRHLQKWIEENKEKLPPNVYYSSYRTQGEGEHLIMEHLRKLDNKRFDDLNHVIYGLDADLIILSLINPAPNIFLFRTREDQIVDIAAFRHALKKMMPNSPSCIEDFAVMTFFLGNDFLPGFPAMMMKSYGLDAMIKIYNELCHKNKGFTLTKGDDLNIDNTKKFIKELSKIEPDLIKHVYRYSTVRPSTLKEDYDEFVMSWYSFIFSPEDTKKMSQIDKLIFSEKERKQYLLLSSEEGDDGEDDELIRKSIDTMCDDYFKMFVWNYRYYKLGMDSVPFSLYYPHYYTPTIQDLSAYLDKKMEKESLKKKTTEESLKKKTTEESLKKKTTEESLKKKTTEESLKKTTGAKPLMLNQMFNVLAPSALKAIFDKKVMEEVKKDDFAFPKSVKVLSNGLSEKEAHLWLCLVPPLFNNYITTFSSRVIKLLEPLNIEALVPREEKHYVRLANRTYDKEVSSRGRGRGRGTYRGRGRGRGKSSSVSEKLQERPSTYRGRGRGRGK